MNIHTWMRREARREITRAVMCGAIIFVTLAYGIYGGPSR